MGTIPRVTAHMQYVCISVCISVFLYVFLCMSIFCVCLCMSVLCVCLCVYVLCDFLFALLVIPSEDDPRHARWSPVLPLPPSYHLRRPPPYAHLVERS